MGHTVSFSTPYIKQCLDNILTLSFYNILTEIENQSTEPSIIENDLMNKIEPQLDKLKSIITDKDGNIEASFQIKTTFMLN